MRRHQRLGICFMSSDVTSMPRRSQKAMTPQATAPVFQSEAKGTRRSARSEVDVVVGDQAAEVNGREERR